MSNSVSWNLQMSVRGGQLDDARALMHEMVEATRAEPGAVQYEWFLSEDSGSCHINESYTGSDAAMTHMASFLANFAERFLACFDPTRFSVYGSPNAELRGVLDGFGAAYLGSLGGFRR